MSVSRRVVLVGIAVAVVVVASLGLLARSHASAQTQPAGANDCAANASDATALDVFSWSGPGPFGATGNREGLGALSDGTPGVSSIHVSGATVVATFGGHTWTGLVTQVQATHCAVLRLNQGAPELLIDGRGV